MPSFNSFQAYNVDMSFFKNYFTLITLLILVTIGLSPFVLNLFPDFNYYPVAFHRNFMLGVLLNFIICRIIHIGINRYKESKKLNKFEIFTPYLLLFLSAISYSKQVPFYIFQTLFFLILIFSVVRRFWIDEKENQFSWYFINSSLVYGLISSVLMISQSNKYFILSKKICYFGLHLGMFLGIALYFVPILFNDEGLIERFKNFFKRKKILNNELQVLFLLFHVQVIGEIFSIYSIILSARFLLLFLPALTYFKLWRLPVQRTWNSLYIWISIWCLNIGMIMAHANQSDFQNWIHLFFINTYLMISIIVFSSLKIELIKLTSKSVKIMFGILLFAGLTRATAYLIPQSYINHLGYAAVLIIAILVWNLYLVCRRA